MKFHAPVTMEHERLRRLANQLGRLHATDSEILWLATALNQIGYGLDANAALGVKRSQGQNDEKEAAHYLTQQAIRWVAGRMNPEGDEKPPLKNVAIEEAAAAFGLDAENLTRACPNVVELKDMATFTWDSQRPKITKT